MALPLKVPVKPSQLSCKPRILSEFWSFALAMAFWTRFKASSCESWCGTETWSFGMVYVPDSDARTGNWLSQNFGGVIRDPIFAKRKIAWNRIAMIILAAFL